MHSSDANLPARAIARADRQLKIGTALLAAGVALAVATSAIFGRYCHAGVRHLDEDRAARAAP